MHFNFIFFVSYAFHFYINVTNINLIFTLSCLSSVVIVWINQNCCMNISTRHAVHHCKFHETSLVSSPSLQPLPSYPLVVDFPWIRILMFTLLPHLMVSSFTSPRSTLSVDQRTPCTTPSSVPCLPLHLVPILQLQHSLVLSLIIYPSLGLCLLILV